MEYLSRANWYEGSSVMYIQASERVMGRSLFAGSGVVEMARL